MGIAAFSPWWGIGALILVGGVLVGWAVRRREQSVRRARVDDLVRGLCELNGRVASDPNLAALLITFTETPAKLDRIERVRARAWFDSARRLHGLLHAALGEGPATDVARSMWVPSMGEAAGRGSGSGRGRIELATEEGALSNFTLIDPEFMAWVEAMRDARGVSE